MKKLCLMSVLALFFTIVLSIPLGVRSAARKSGLFDKTVYIFGIICMSLPNYWIGYLLLIAYTYFSIHVYFHVTHFPYHCGHCGKPLRHKGICPHCGAMND